MWLALMHDEISIMHEQRVWHLTPLPANTDAVGCRGIHDQTR